MDPSGTLSGIVSGESVSVLPGREGRRKTFMKLCPAFRQIEREQRVFLYLLLLNRLSLKLILIPQ